MESLERHIVAMAKLNTDTFTIGEIETAFDGVTSKYKIPDDDAADAWKTFAIELAMIHFTH